MTKPANRIHTLDELRGFALILMIAYHLIFDLTYFFPTAFGTAIFPMLAPFQLIIPFLFISVSGISAQLSHNALRRGLFLTGVAVAITVFSLLIFPKAPVYFGIIHLLAVCYLICLFLHPLLGRIPPLLGLVISLLLFVMTYHLSEGFFGIRGLFSVDVSFLQGNDIMLYPLGWLNVPLAAGDYYPLFPWFFLFLAGSFLGVYAGEGRFPPWMHKPHIPPFGFLGRHALIFYCAHQPVILGLLWLGFRLGLLPDQNIESFLAGI